MSDPLAEAIRRTQADIRAYAQTKYGTTGGLNVDSLTDRLMEKAWYGKEHPSPEAYGAVRQALHNAATGKEQQPLPFALFREAGHGMWDGPAADMKIEPNHHRRGDDETVTGDERVDSQKHANETNLMWALQQEEDASAARWGDRKQAATRLLLPSAVARLLDRPPQQLLASPLLAWKAKAAEVQQPPRNLMLEAAMRRLAAEKALERPNANMATERPYIDGTGRWMQPVEGGLLRTENPEGFD